MSSGSGAVERTIRDRIRPGQILQSPETGYPPKNQSDFAVTNVGDMGIWVDKLNQWIQFDVLARVVSEVRAAGGAVLIGSKQGWADGGTLERFLQDARGNNTRTSTYVAPVLVECGIAEYVPQAGAKCIRLAASFR